MGAPICCFKIAQREVEQCQNKDGEGGARERGSERNERGARKKKKVCFFYFLPCNVVILMI